MTAHRNQHHDFVQQAERYSHRNSRLTIATATFRPTGTNTPSTNLRNVLHYTMMQNVECSGNNHLWFCR